ncbi:MAG: hypothetical protein AAFP22_23345, partial [Planctomycetota bacterium]
NRGQTQLSYIVSDVLPATNPGNAYWDKPDDGRGGFVNDSPRIICWSTAVMMHALYSGPAAVRSYLDGTGVADATSWPNMLAQCLEHIQSGNGILASRDETGTSGKYFPEYPPDFVTRLGSHPHPDHFAGPEHWPVSQVRHGYYWVATMPMLQRFVARDPARVTAFDDFFYHLRTIDRAFETVRPDGEAIYPVGYHPSVGNAGHQNARMDRATAETTAGCWLQVPFRRDPSDSYFTDRAPHSTWEQLGVYWYRWQDVADEVKRLMKRQWGVAPSTISDDELLRLLFDNYKAALASGSSTRYQARGSAALGALQKAGAAVAALAPAGTAQPTPAPARYVEVD